MKELIAVCKLQNNKLVIIDECKLKTNLDTEKVELYVIYKRKRYVVNGNYLMPYIII